MRVVYRLFILVLIAGAPLGTLMAQGARSVAATADVPVSRVVLFSSGVGYFEHAGTVRGNGSTELRFRTSQINDILKSIMLQDQDGGRIGAITYPSQDPLAKTLKSFQVDITQNPSLADLLNQLRGARVTIQALAEKLSGTVLGVETRRKPVAQGQPVEMAELNLLSGATIRAVELESISSLSLDDPQLQDELTKALGALVQARDQDKKPVTINFNGTGDRRVRIGYVVETPIWKTSYRLLLVDKSKSAHLQGWAIVENQTESDWNGVSLALVSGRPISFMMDLYQPLYSTRPTVVPELFAGLRPQVYDGGIAAEKASAEMVPAAAPAPAQAQRRIGYGPDGRPLTNALSAVITGAAPGAWDMASSVQSMASSGQLGELFQYTVGNVTLARQKSAMLPIVTDSVAIERLSIYNPSVLRTNPLNGIRFENTSGKHLLQGPVTVLDGGAYAGDARIDNVPPGQSRMLSYGIDLDMTVNSEKNTSSASIVTAKITKGMFVLSRRLVTSREYVADNKSSKNKMLVIEHPVRANWKLVDTQKPFETTPALYRFKGAAAANTVTTLVVKEESVQDETMLMAATGVDQLAAISRAGAIPRDVRDALTRAVQLKQAVVDVDREIAARARQLSEITAEQNRIRENMKTVAQSTQYYERLLSKLNEQESSIEKLQTERDNLTTKRNELQRQLEEYLNGLTVG